MDSIKEAFIEAGYYRAQISSLTDFDKIIGGIAWAMQFFSLDVGINIFYTDTMDLGQKIALTERLVMVLLVMDCPHQIEPHQIVGLDYENLLPVVRWLIKRSSEIRSEHEAFNRLLALRYFFRVTNTLPDRSKWCHVIPENDLKRIEDSQQMVTPKKRDAMASGSLEASAAVVMRIKEDFKLNQQVSFVKIPPRFRFANRMDQADTPDEPLDTDDLRIYNEDIQETELKQEVKDQMIEEISASTSAPTSKLDEDQKLHLELDMELLETNQEILYLATKIDCLPSDLERKQYQLRYAELHKETNRKVSDLKRSYDLFNTLQSIKHYQTRELNLLDSISSNLHFTHNSPANQAEFIRQNQDILNNIQSILQHVENKLTESKERWSMLSKEYAALFK